MRIAIIGGTEFIGRRIVERLVERGDDVLVVHRGRTEPDDLPVCKHLHVDRRNFVTVAGEFSAWAPDAVIDTMALTSADVEAVLPHLPDVPVVVLSSMDEHPDSAVADYAADDAALAIVEPDVQLVLAAYAAFGRGDIDAAVAGLHPDVDWIEPEEFPNGGAHRGPAAVAGYLQASYEGWRELHSEVTAHRRGERILIVHRVSGVLGDGTPHDATVADVFTVRDGLVVHMIAYGDPAEAFVAHPA
jgi:ketosteroid isomerase-like protein